MKDVIGTIVVLAIYSALFGIAAYIMLHRPPERVPVEDDEE